MGPGIRIERTVIGRRIEAARNQNLWIALGARLAAKDAARQERIRLYQQRAEQGLSLFGRVAAE